MPKTIDMEQAGSRLPDLIERAVTAGDRVILCRQGKPVAVAISPESLPATEALPSIHPESLAAVAGTWEDFDEIEPYIEEAYRARQQQSALPLSLD